jgi:two-component system, sensor histidine kinase LadS
MTKTLFQFTLSIAMPLILFGQNTNSIKSTSAFPVLIYTDSTKYVEISPYAAVLEDANKEWSIEQVKAMPDSCFQKTKKTFLNLGNTDSRFWVRYELSNKTNEDLYWINAASVIHYLDLYLVSEDGQLKAFPPSGSARPFENRSLPLANINFNLGKNPKTIFGSIASKQGLVFVNHIGSKDAIYDFARRSERFNFFYIGLSFMLMIYTLAIYLNSRDTSFLWYVLFQCFAIFFILH